MSKYFLVWTATSFDILSFVSTPHQEFVWWNHPMRATIGDGVENLILENLGGENCRWTAAATDKRAHTRAQTQAHARKQKTREITQFSFFFLVVVGKKKSPI